MKLSSRIRARFVVPAAIVALAVSALAPDLAAAATVGVEEVPGREGGAFSVSVVHFAAAPGERNAVSIAPATGDGLEREGVPPVVLVRDTGAPLTPGPGCTALDANAATCTLHAPHRIENSPGCGTDCYIPVPGSGWLDAGRIELGDEGDSFDSSTVGAGCAIEVDGGSGDDRVTTGSGDDTITPGPGNDLIEPRAGENRVIADPRPDDDDTLDFAPGSANAVDDSARTEPLHLADHVLGAAGEADSISGPAQVIGGSGDDELIGAGEALEGGPGGDKLIGSPGDDEIEGGPGDDIIRGEGGNDTVFDYRGDDVIEGDEGDDFLRAGDGADLVVGGPGNDRLYGEAGDDTVKGGAGGDLVSGDAGSDTIRGGAGADRLISGFDTAEPGMEHKADLGVDSVDCGPGEDTSVVNVWDKLQGCEGRRIMREVRVVEVRAHPARGSATVFFIAPSTEPAKLAIGGAGVKPGSYVSHRGSTTLEGAFLVRAQGAALKNLRRTDHLRLTVDFSWQLSGRPAVRETRPVTLGLKLTEKGSGRR